MFADSRRRKGLFGICVIASLLIACNDPQGGTPASPDQCIIDRVNQPSIAKADDVQQLNCASRYPQLCTAAALEAQTTCDTACLQFTKRRTQDPQNPTQLLNCPADPVQTTIDAYNAANHCVRNPAGGTELPYKVTCTVSYVCTCDP